MTDLERARALLRTAFRACSYDEGEGYTTIHATGGLIVILHKDFAQALAAARREGAEEMRERAARECEALGDKPGHDCVANCAALIRALPLVPEEPARRQPVAPSDDPGRSTSGRLLAAHPVEEPK